MLPALGVSVPDAARDLGMSRAALYRILAETGRITPEIALRLGKYCGNGPDFWLRMQVAYDLREVERELRPIIRAIRTRGAVTRSALRR
jgi:addiction module HigA family antidote